MGGLYAFLAGVIAIIAAFLFGKRSSKTKISGEVTIEREKAELSQKVSETVVETMKSQSEIKSEIQKAEETLEIADKQRDTNMAIEVARRLAKMAEGLL